jgi:hypothetical protein
VHQDTTAVFVELFFYFFQHWPQILWLLSNNHHIIEYNSKLRKFEFFKLAGINNAFDDELSKLGQLDPVARLDSF